MIHFPNISPEIFSINIFGLTLVLRWYAVSYILGFFCAISIMKFYIRRNFFWRDHNPPINSDQADTLLTFLILGVILGGRLGYVLFYNLGFYLTNPIDIFRIWDGGMSFHGGFLGVVFAILFFCKKNNLLLWSTSDLIAVSTPPGLFFGRVANFINAELWGRPTDVPWGIIFPGDRAQDCIGVVGPCARHPTQLYEAGLEGILLFLVLVILAKNNAFFQPGRLTGLFLVGYGCSRFFVEFYRVPDLQFFSTFNPNGHALIWGDFGITMGQALSLPMIIVGLILFTVGFTKKFKVEK